MSLPEGYDEMFDPEAILADFTPAVNEALKVLWAAGFAVIAFCPTELQGVDPDDVCEAMCIGGWDAIDSLKEV